MRDTVGIDVFGGGDFAAVVAEQTIDLALIHDATMAGFHGIIQQGFTTAAFGARGATITAAKAGVLTTTSLFADSMRQNRTRCAQGMKIELVAGVVE